MQRSSLGTSYTFLNDTNWTLVYDRRFNEIASHNEKEVGRQHSESSFLPFKQILSNFRILEFPFTGK